MHALPSYPKSPLIVGMLVFVLALFVIAAAAPDLASVEFSLPWDGTGTATPESATPAAPPASEPAWVGDPLASPLESLSATR